MALELHGTLARWNRASRHAGAASWHLTLERPKLTLERRRALEASKVGRIDVIRPNSILDFLGCTKLIRVAPKLYKYSPKSSKTNTQA